jgi:hypothetical protein
MWERIYDGSLFCSDNSCCPVVEIERTKGLVRIHDPARPENGSVVMTVEEYRTLRDNAPRI